MATNRSCTFVVMPARGGAQATCLNSEVVVGDVLCLDTGDKIVADGYMIDGHGLVVDEASLTGEAEPIKKGERDPWMRSGTQVGRVGWASRLVS